MEQVLRKRLDALGPASRAELLHVLMLPDFERADRIGEFWRPPLSLPMRYERVNLNVHSVLEKQFRSSEPLAPT